MEFRTIVDIPKYDFQIDPCEPILFVGSCFADEIGSRFRDNGFPVVINPFGVMYNPVSILHTITRYDDAPRLVFLTLGTNYVYRLKSSGEIVDNCEKRPQRLFQEEVLTIEECRAALQQCVDILHQRNPEVRVITTVSPIRYRKYGYHESQLSKAALLIAASSFTYFPSYEILMDELRDYRFYASDMLHPSTQAVDYIWERIVENLFSPAARTFLDEWQPLRKALSHKPFHPDSSEYQDFMDKTMLKLNAFRKKYPTFAL